MIRLVLWDIDGTLIASGGAGLHAFAAVAASAFERPGGTSGLSFAGRTDYSIVREFFAAQGIEPSPDRFERFLGDYVHWLDHYLGRLAGRVLPGVREWLDGIRALPEAPVQGLLTGNIRLGAEIKLRHFGLWDEFELELGAFADDHEDRNRLAAIARDRGARRLGGDLRGEEILVIGDTPLDIACARAIGARCLAVATGGVPLATLLEHRPDWVVPDLLAASPAAICR